MYVYVFVSSIIFFHISFALCRYLLTRFDSIPITKTKRPSFDSVLSCNARTICPHICVCVCLCVFCSIEFNSYSLFHKYTSMFNVHIDLILNDKNEIATNKERKRHTERKTIYPTKWCTMYRNGKRMCSAFDRDEQRTIQIETSVFIDSWNDMLS